MENILETQQGTFELDRLPKRPLELLRAWDAADEYLLAYLSAHELLSNDSRILIYNDSFGALAVALNQFKPIAISDSFLSQQSTKLNLSKNKFPEDSVQFINSLDGLSGTFDTVIIKAPKTLALLEDQLLRLHPHLTASTQVIVGGMIKTLPPSVWALLERLVGPTTTGLARKKARLIFVTPDLTLNIPLNRYPTSYQLEESDKVISNHANVFSREKLDIGTRFFLQHLPVGLGNSEIIDLGCGNGLVGLMVAQKNPAATVHFIDESFMAVASAKDNFHRAFGVEGKATFCVGDGLCDIAAASADLILCNPPFHQHNTVGDQIANSMIKESKRVLRVGGQLLLIGNRHLNYHLNLNRLFGSHTVIATNNKFIILKATLKR